MSCDLAQPRDCFAATRLLAGGDVIAGVGRGGASECVGELGRGGGRRGTGRLHH